MAGYVASLKMFLRNGIIGAYKNCFQEKHVLECAVNEAGALLM